MDEVPYPDHRQVVVRQADRGASLTPPWQMPVPDVPGTQVPGTFLRNPPPAKLDTLEKLANAFGISISDLLEL